eukprot:7400958-Lingulodinium_polyedra.AAC.1
MEVCCGIVYASVLLFRCCAIAPPCVNRSNGPPLRHSWLRPAVCSTTRFCIPRERCIAPRHRPERRCFGAPGASMSNSRVMPAPDPRDASSLKFRPLGRPGDDGQSEKAL